MEHKPPHALRIRVLNFFKLFRDFQVQIPGAHEPVAQISHACRLHQQVSTFNLAISCSACTVIFLQVTDMKVSTRIRTLGRRRQANPVLRGLQCQFKAQAVSKQKVSPGLPQATTNRHLGATVSI